MTARDKFNGKRVHHNFTAEHAILNRAPNPLSRNYLPLADAIARMYPFCGCPWGRAPVGTASRRSTLMATGFPWPARTATASRRRMTSLCEAT